MTPAVKTAKKHRVVGRPFVKGDPRINRKGRPPVPKSIIDLQALIDEIADEEVVNPSTGEKIQRLRAMLRSMMTGKETSGKIHILDRRYGKVPQSVDVTSGGESIAPTIIEIIKHESVK